MDLSYLLLYFVFIIPSAIIHEYAHGFVAERLGDPTARYAGRLTINPVAHIDLWGTIIMPIVLYILSGGTFMFAYAKPVPYNPYNLRNQKWGPALVGLAGPMANFLLAFVFAIVVRSLTFFHYAGFWATFMLAFVPIIASIVVTNVRLMVFNLVPIPPLDGSKILYALLPDSMESVKNFLDRYGYMLLLIFIFFLIDSIQPVITYIVRFLLAI